MVYPWGQEYDPIPREEQAMNKELKEDEAYMRMKGEEFKAMTKQLQEAEAKVMVTKLTEKLADYEDACRQKQEIIDTESSLVADYLLMREGLESIANNTCCIGCQEARRVAKDILEKTK